METGKLADESASEMAQLVLPNDTNSLGCALGGSVMQWIDIIAGITAKRHSRRQVVTAAMEALVFRHPIRMGAIVILKSRMVYVGKSSMVIDVDVFAEDPLTGIRQKTSRATLTFVGLDDNGKPVQVPGLILSSAQDEIRYNEILKNRQKEER